MSKHCFFANHKMYRLFIVAIGLFSAVSAGAQNYYFTYHEGGNPQTSQGLVPNLQSDDAGETSGWDLLMSTSTSHSYSSTVILPFPFQFANSSAPAIKVASSGYITFDTMVTGIPVQGPLLLPSTQLPDKSVVIWGLSNHGANDQILTRTFGSAPNRQFWVKFSSMSTPGDTSGTFGYFSIVLEESSNRIYIVEMHQGFVLDNPVAPRLNPGIQINSTTSAAIDNQTNKTYFNELSKRPTDNAYYEFKYGNQLVFDLETEITDVPASIVQSTQGSLQFRVYNNGSLKADSTIVYFSVNGSGPVSKKYQTGNSLLPSRTGYLEDVFTITPADPPGTLYNIRIWVEMANLTPEINRSNDTASVNFVVSAGTSAVKNVLVESGTACWCSECPVANLVLDAAAAKHPDTIIIVRHHSLDDMEGNGDSLNSAYLDRLPGNMVNRSSFLNGSRDVPADSILALAESEIGSYTPVLVSVSNLSLNETTREFKFRIKATLTDHYYGPLSIGGMVTEDKVRGVGVGFNQAIDRKYTTDPSNWYYNFSTPIIGYYHNRVVWNLPGGVMGIPVAGGKLIWNPGDTFSQEFTWTYPALLKTVTISQSPYLPTGTVYSYGKPADMGAVGFVSAGSGADFQILNSDYTSLWDTVLSMESVQGAATLVLYPNPSAGLLHLKATRDNYVIRIYTVSGALIFETKQVISRAPLVIDMNELGAENGLYLIEMVNSHGQRLTDRFILNR